MKPYLEHCDASSEDEVGEASDAGYNDHLREEEEEGDHAVEHSYPEKDVYYKMAQ